MFLKKFNYLKYPFIKVGSLDDNLLHNILILLRVETKEKIFPYIPKTCKSKSEVFKSNWLNGVQFLSPNCLANLDKSIFGEEIKKIISRDFNHDSGHLSLESGLIFEPSKCKYKLQNKFDTFLYHYFHVDSCFRYKILIPIDTLESAQPQFSYIDKSNYKKRGYFINILLPGILIRFFSSIIRRLTFNKICLNLQPPKLNSFYQNRNNYVHLNNLKRGSYIVFNNLHPHCSHTGPYEYKVRMVQLVYK